MKTNFEALGKRTTGPSRSLETFEAPASVATVTFTTDEVTSLCPVTGQPDFGTVTIEYEPDKLCIESKSLKLYLWSYRNEALFGETLAEQIAHDIAEACQPERCKVTVEQNIRGGIQMTVVAET